MSDTELIAYALPQPDGPSLYIFYIHYYSSGYCEEIWLHFLEDIKPKDSHARDQLGEGRTYYLQQARRTLRIFPKVVSSQTAKLGEVLS